VSEDLIAAAGVNLAAAAISISGLATEE